VDRFDLYRTFDATSTMRLDFHPVRDGFHFGLPALTIPRGTTRFQIPPRRIARRGMSDY
jgi:hypothetical protein